MTVPIRSIVVLGGGSAGFIVALTLRRKLPHLRVRVVRSPDIGVIGVGEGTTTAFPRHFFEYLRLKPQEFHAHAEPTWKLGLRFLWGSRKEFYYSFAYEYQHRYPDLSRNNGFFINGEYPLAGRVSAFMAQDKAFMRRSDGSPHFHDYHAYHIENKKLVEWLERVSRGFGVEVLDARVTPELASDGIAALITDGGERVTADLFVDASGFRSELLGLAMKEPFISYADTLFCNRAVIAGWPRTDEPIHPYTTAETMDAGWCWQIEHEHWINRGYVYASDFVSDDAARGELRQKNPKIANEPRFVNFRTGRYERFWVGNVVAVGNAAGFVEPLEATALQVICAASSTLADSLIDCCCAPTPTLMQLYNRVNGRMWDEIRDFLSIHYKFNTRLDTPFWRAARADTALHGAQRIVDFYKENGPSVVAGVQLLHPANFYGMDGYIALLLGQGASHDKPYLATAEEEKAWREHCRKWSDEARHAMDVRQSLEAIRKLGMKWD